MDNTLNNQTSIPESPVNPSESNNEAPEAGLCEVCHNQDKQNVYDWMKDAPETVGECDFIEVQFKNTRKGYYLNHLHLDLHKGDIVAVEGNPGHDIGTVTLTGYLVSLQMKKTNAHTDDPANIRKVFRIAKPTDIERYKEAKAKEHDTMLRARKIAEDLKLEMKIGDVEYQGDGNKAIFYYIADGRVDFRQLIKVLAEAFKVRIEMKQIGARQEAGRIGGIGPCGRELCCSGWITKFMSVGTSVARFQDLSLNPQKLAGQCAKLKCCLNYEVDCYMEANKELPAKDIILQTKDADYHFFKADILRKKISYSTSKDGAFNLETISTARAHEIIGMNKLGQKPERLAPETEAEENSPEFSDGVGDEELTRFDHKKNKRGNRKKNNDTRENQNGNPNKTKGTSSQLKKSDKEPEEKTAMPPQNPAQNNSSQNQRPKRHHHRNNSKDKITPPSS